MDEPRIGLQAFRDAMSSFPAGVAVVTTWDESGDPRGATVSALCSLSAEPPLLLVCLANTSDTGQALSEGTPFLVNILSDDQSDIATLFATKEDGKFDRCLWSTGLESLPEIAGEGGSRIACTTLSRSWGGDHSVIVGTIVAARTSESGRPLLHYRREFGSFRALALGDVQ